MRAVAQRVTRAAVRVGGAEPRPIGAGLVILLGVERDDTPEDAAWLAEKLPKLRLFEDEHGAMARSAADIRAEYLVVSQFTLHASTKKGTKPSFHRAEAPDRARALYETFLAELEKAAGMPAVTGEFGAPMEVELVNHGPVTLILDSRRRE